MFSGITQGLRRVLRVTREPGLLTYEVDMSGLHEGLRPGASVSIDGCCQTVTHVDVSGRARFDAMQQTLNLTTLDALCEGAEVSVERSAKVGDELGGHEVSGHVTGRGRVAEVAAHGHDFALWIEVPQDWEKYLFAKGFVAVCGSSLTVSGVRRSDDGAFQFSVHLIPETLRLTKLGKLPLGSDVNIELDPKTVAIVDTTLRVLQSRGLG